MATKYETILIAVDASEEADKVLETATQIEPGDTARFRVVTVVPEVMIGTSGMDGASFAASWPLKEMEEAIKTEIAENVRERAARFGIAPDQVDVLVGRPAAVIRAHAVNLGADLIVIGSHGRHALPQVMLGSTANGVLHGAECDVLTARIRERQG